MIQADVITLGQIMVVVLASYSIFGILRALFQERKEWLVWSRWRNKKSIHRGENIFRKLFPKSFNPSALSRQAPERQAAMTQFHLQYGELPFLGLAEILQCVQPKAWEHFIDLGSGTGRVVFAAALLWPMASYKGVELLTTLHAVSCEKKHELEILLAKQSYLRARLRAIVFEHQDLLQTDFSTADIIFVCLPTWPAFQWLQLIERFHELRSGSRLICIDKTIISPEFQRIYYQFFRSGTHHYRVEIFLKH